MANFLTIAGTNYPVQTGGASQGEPDYGGSRERAFAGNLRSTRDTPKDSWTFTIGPITRDQASALMAATREDAIVAVGGDAIAGGPFDCMVDVQEGGYTPKGTSDHNRVLRVLILQV